MSIFTGSNDEAFHLSAVPCSQFLSPFSTWVDDSLIFFSVTADLLNITLGGSAQETNEYRTSVHEKKINALQAQEWRLLFFFLHDFH